MLYYDFVLVPAANAHEPPSAAAQCINQHHSEGMEEKQPPADTAARSDALFKALEIDELETKKQQNGTLTKSEQSRWKRLTSHFVTAPLDTGPDRYPRDE